MAKFTRNSVLPVRKESFEAIESTKRRMDLTSKGWVSARFSGAGGFCGFWEFWRLNKRSETA